MSGFLASVRSCAEARLALAGGADIIDVKEPSAGALGSVDRPTLAGIIRTLQGCRPVSATIGDVSLVPENIVARVTETAATGVDIVKIGIFSGDLDATLDALAPLARRGIRLVAVIFADRVPDLDALVPRCAAAGFAGIMLDTAEKGAGSLTSHLSLAALARFVGLARRHRLLSGLAGSLRLVDIPDVGALGADYLGFRSALTVGGRDRSLDVTALHAVRAALRSAAPTDGGRIHLPWSSNATEMAVARSAAAAESVGFANRTVASKAR